MGAPGTVKYCMVLNWFRHFKKDYTSLECKLKSGKPSVVEVEVFLEMVEQQSRRSTSTLSAEHSSYKTLPNDTFNSSALWTENLFMNWPMIRHDDVGRYLKIIDMSVFWSRIGFTFVVPIRELAVKQCNFERMSHCIFAVSSRVSFTLILSYVMIEWTLTFMLKNCSNYTMRSKSVIQHWWFKNTRSPASWQCCSTNTVNVI